MRDEDMGMTHVPAGFEDLVDPLRAAHERLLARLAERGIEISDAPAPRTADPSGVGAARAYPIQGVLKYHGMADWHWRTAFLPSISVNSDAAYSVTWVGFQADLAEDEVTIGGQRAAGRELERVVRVLDAVREVAGFGSRARVLSRNVVRASQTGKGLGTSASAGAALAAAALSAAFGPQVLRIGRLVGSIARLLAGSACRSVAGGISLWLSYPGIAPEECVAVRLDAADELSDMRLVTVPIASRVALKTEQAHRDAPSSPFFRPWLATRESEIIDCAEAVWRGDWRRVGQWAELDSVRLHGVTMSASMENKLFAWEPENMALFRLCNALRDAGHPVYFSTDTGPTTVFLTHRQHESALVSAIADLDHDLEIVRGRVAGPVESVDPPEALRAIGEADA